MFGRRQKLKYEVVASEGYEDEIEIEPAKAKFFSPPCVWSSFSTALLISVYFAPSIGLTFYQRWLYQKFHFPLTTVLIHMVVKFLLAAIIRFVMSCRTSRPRLMVGWKEYIYAVAPTGVFSGFDIGFSNWGLELINISLYTMTKSTTVIFILGFAILFKLEKRSWSLCTIVVMISVGLILFTYKAAQFNFLGFILVLIASISSGLRWTCVQLMLQKSKLGMKNPIDMILHMQPWMIISLLPFALIIEGSTLISSLENLENKEYFDFLNLFGKVLIGAFIAFFMELSEVLVVTYTSSLTLSIAGIFKEIIILVLAVQWNGDKMSVVNELGLLICLCGISSHVIHKVKAYSISHAKPFKFVERGELSESLINDVPEKYGASSDSEHSDTQELFNILNRHDR